jgi:dCTP diphosphatase
MHMADSLQDTLKAIRQFRDERDWMQFHDPKSMAASIAIEAAELLEHFQWKSKEEAEQYAKTHKDEIADELADVATYLFELSENCGIDLVQAVQNKLKKNAQKYPIHKSKGVHTKYNQL